MADRKAFEALTSGLGFYDDCPVCGCSWPACHGLCAAHASLYPDGSPGPFHRDFNDDCELCKEEANGDQSRP